MKKKKQGARASARVKAKAGTKTKSRIKTKSKSATKPRSKSKPKSKPKTKTVRGGVKALSARRALAAPAVAKQAAAEPECMDMGDAIRAVRECLAEIAGSAAGHVDTDESVSNVLPDSIEVRRYLDLIRKRTGFDLDPTEMGGGTFQAIADALACAG